MLCVSIPEPVNIWGALISNGSCTIAQSGYSDPVSFRPTCALEVLSRRAQLLKQLRAFLEHEAIMEVEVPVLGDATVTDPHLSVLSAGPLYLQTSPEFYMKRLLAAGAPSIYSLGKAFRADESGRRHRCEFTMLEWYCLGWDDRQLVAQIARLLKTLAPAAPVNVCTYASVFERELGLDPYSATPESLRDCARAHLDLGREFELDGKSAWLDLVFSHLIEPRLTEGFTIVTDYPAEHCALARVANNRDGVAVARRFEVFGFGLELANGYWELTDAEEQQRRFEADRQWRRAQAMTVPDIDWRFLAALQHGLPNCAGVALGVDRLLMALLHIDDIAGVMAFADR